MKKMKMRSNTITAVISIFLIICMMSMFVISSSASTIENDNSYDDNGSLTYYYTNGTSVYYHLGQYQGALYYNKTTQKINYDFTILVPSSMQKSKLTVTVRDLGNYSSWGTGSFNTVEENMIAHVQVFPEDYTLKLNISSSWSSANVYEFSNFSVSNGKVYYFDMTFSAKQENISCRVDRHITGLVHHSTGMTTAQYYINICQTNQSNNMT